MAQWLSYPLVSGPFSGQEQLLAASSTSPGAGMIRIPWSAVNGLIAGTGFLPLTGGTLTGPLTLPGNATLPLQAVPLQQVQAITGGPFLQLAGGTLTGPLILAADPTAALGAATKEYVDGAVAGGPFLPLTGGTVTGPIVLPGNATLALQAVPLQQVTAIIGGPYLPLAGGTLTGALVLAADPTLSLGAATKHYVDAAVVSGPFLPLAGGTVTGATTFSADVTFSGAGTGLAVSNNATVGGTFVATGGINGTPVGAVTPSTGAFTNLTASGTVTLPSTTTGPFLLLTGGTVSGPTTFSGSGTALTVTNNLTAGSINSTPIGATTASTGKFTNLTATGTVTIDGIIAPYLPTSAGVHSIAESGAVGDGITDDRPVIQAWLNTLGTGGDEVLLQPGKFYYIGSAPLTIPGNIIIRGAYGALDDQNAIPGSFFNGGGFFINPTLPVGIIMGPASSLVDCKVYRSGLISGATQAQVLTAVTAWAAEAGYYQTNASMSNGATVIPLSNTSGISTGMSVTGPGLYLTTPCTVVSIVTNTSVTISTGVVGAQTANAYYRFGPSIAITIPINTGGVIIRGVTVVGFRTGFQIIPGEYHIEFVHMDCITAMEFYQGGAAADVSNSRVLPLYGTLAGTLSRVGDAMFIHDGGVSTRFYNVYIFDWTLGWHWANNVGGVCVACGDEVLDGAGNVNWWIENGSQMVLDTCHAQAAGIGFHIQNANNFRLVNCSSVGGQTNTANNIAHFFIDSTSSQSMVGEIVAPSTFTNYPSKVPILFSGANITAVAITKPSIADMSAISVTAPFIQGTLPNGFSPEFTQGIVYRTFGSSGTVTLNAYWNGVIIDSSSPPIVGFTITLFPFPMDGQRFDIWFNTAIQNLQWATTDGSTVGNYANPGAGDHFTLIYNAAQSMWFVGGVGQTINFGSVLDSSQSSFTNHITLFGTTYGIGITSNHMNFIGPAGVSYSFLFGGAQEAALTAGKLSFSNATANIIDFAQIGIGAPTFTTRSVGTKLVLYDSITGSTADMGFGVAGGTLWAGVRTTSDQFQWYGGTTLAATLDGAGNLDIVGGLTVEGLKSVFPALQASASYANDAAAGAGGVVVGQVYRNGSIMQIRIT